MIRFKKPEYVGAHFWMVMIGLGDIVDGVIQVGTLGFVSTSIALRMSRCLMISRWKHRDKMREESKKGPCSSTV